MRKMNLLFRKMMVPVMMGVVMTIAFTGCKKDDDDSNLAPLGTLAPPEWANGTWGPGGLLTDYVISTNDFIPANSTMTFKELTELASTVSEAFGGGAIKVKEMRKTDDLYEVGTHDNSSSPLSDPAYCFKKGDGTYIEVAEYDSDNKKYGEYKRYDKKTK